MAPRVTAVPVLLLLLLAATAAPTAREDAEARRRKQEKSDEWKIVRKYEAGFSTRGDDGHSRLAAWMELQAKGTSTRKLMEHPLLAQQAPGYQQAPWFFLIPTLHGEGMSRTKLYIRGDNLYISCFTNGPGKIFCFNDNQHNSYTIPGPETIILPFDGSYADLVGDEDGGEAWRNLVGLDLTKTAVNAAIRVVSTYHIGKTTEAEIMELKRALATLVVFVCESARFPHIRQLVGRAFEGEEGATTLDHKGAQLVVQWKRISCAILIWNMNKKWESVEARELAVTYPYGPGITTYEEALATIGPILRAEKCSVKYKL